MKTVKTTLQRGLVAAVLLNLLLFAVLGINYGVAYLVNPSAVMTPGVSAQTEEEPGSVATVEDARRTQTAFINAVENVSPAVVSITTTSTVQNRFYSPFQDDPFFRRFFGDDAFGPREYQQQGLGSGVIVTEDGLIITNNHVVEDVDEITVHLDDDRQYSAELVGSDPQTDIAVIRINTEESFPTAPLGNSDDLEPGQWAIAIGAPFGLTQTVTVGVISAVGRGGMGLNDYEDFIQTDAAINPGNSGGPLVDINGAVIGINAAIRSNTGQYGGIGFAIPINMAKKVMDDLVESGSVSRGYLGVQIEAVTAEMQDEYELPDEHGVMVRRVFTGTPAAEAGLRVGDVILSINDRETNDANTLRNIVANTPVGQKVLFEIRRDGETMEIAVRIAELPEDGYASIQDATYEDLGLTLQEIDEQVARENRLRVQMGLLITAVEEGSSADRADLKAGSVILEVENQPVATLAEFEQALLDAEGRTVEMRVYQDRRSMDVTLRR